MKKIELSSIESKNMTAAPEEIVMEVNGGCTFKYKTVYTCGGSTMDWVYTSYCGKGCPIGAVRHYKKFYNTDATSVHTSPNGKSYNGQTVWFVEADPHWWGVNLVRTNDNPYGWKSTVAGD